jgi:signal transduction histidine kinase
MNYRQELLLPQSIRETIDDLPGGICFSEPSGKLILTNHMMNKLVYQLTGSTIMNLKTTWDELKQCSNSENYHEIEKYLLEDNIKDISDERMFFSFPDKTVWRFQKEILCGEDYDYIQLYATDITKLYENSKELYENNQRLALQYERMRILLSNIVKINQEKELLSAKMRIHDDLGQVIISTKQYLSDLKLPEKITSLVDNWNKVIQNLSDFTNLNNNIETSPEDELIKAAQMIGCSIVINGERPVDRKSMLLFYAAIREALTNAVLHAKANQLNIDISKSSSA